MPTPFPLLNAFPLTGNPNLGAIRAVLAEAFPLFVVSAAAAADLDLTGYPVQELRLEGRSFLYDAADTTTAHDGVACLVTFDGKRFKSEVVALVRHTVLDRDLDTPPGAPDVGDQYLIPAAPMGAWAAHAEEVAIYTARGWRYVAPEVGMSLYVADEDGYVHYTAAGSWDAGLGSTTIGAGAIGLTQLAHPFGVNVEAQQNAPPGGTPAALTAYIVGTAPSGAWAAHANAIAVADGAGGWTFYAPTVGDRVFNRANGLEVFWKAGAWSVDSPSFAVQAATSVINATIFTPNSGYALLDSMAFTAVYSDSVMRFTLFNNSSNLAGVNALFLSMDADLTAKRTFVRGPSTTDPQGLSFTSETWVREFHPGDTATHTYHLRVGKPNTQAGGNIAYGFRWMIEEIRAALL